MIELEKTYLAKEIPKGINSKKDMLDIYIPKSAIHPVTRIRKNGENYEITKKSPINKEDRSKQNEDTIILSEQEYCELKELEGKRLEKDRYLMKYKGKTAEIDIFKGKLKGLVLIDFEFETEKEKDDFQIPDFCLADVTQEDFVAGGMLCGKSYEDIEKELERFNYKRL